jgi:hypothetical protein
MDAERLVSLRRAEPFKPFNLVMKDGRNLPVERASYLAISPDRTKLVYAKTGGGFEILAVDHVADAVVDEQMQTMWRRLG